MKFRDVRSRPDGLADEPNALGGTLLLKMQDSQQMQRIRLPWQACQNLPIPLRRLAPSPRLMMRHGLLEDALG
jgi:hypothetical protein